MVKPASGVTSGCITRQQSWFAVSAISEPTAHGTTTSSKNGKHDRASAVAIVRMAKRLLLLPHAWQSAYRDNSAHDRASTVAIVRMTKRLLLLPRAWQSAYCDNNAHNRASTVAIMRMAEHLLLLPHA